MAQLGRIDTLKVIRESTKKIQSLQNSEGSSDDFKQQRIMENMREAMAEIGVNIENYKEQLLKSVSGQDTIQAMTSRESSEGLTRQSHRSTSVSLLKSYILCIFRANTLAM